MDSTLAVVLTQIIRLSEKRQEPRPGPASGKEWKGATRAHGTRLSAWAFSVVCVVYLWPGASSHAPTVGEVRWLQPANARETTLH